MSTVAVVLDQQVLWVKHKELVGQRSVAEGPTVGTAETAEIAGTILGS